MTEKGLRFRHGFELCHHLLDRGQGQDDYGEQGFRTQVRAVVYQRVYRRGHIVISGIDAEENQAGKESEEIPPQYAQQISFDQTVFGVGEDAGKAQGSESEDVIHQHLRKADDIGIADELQKAVGDGG